MKYKESRKKLVIRYWGEKILEEAGREVTNLVELLKE